MLLPLLIPHAPKAQGDGLVGHLICVVFWILLWLGVWTHAILVVSSIRVWFGLVGGVGGVDGLVGHLSSFVRVGYLGGGVVDVRGVMYGGFLSFTVFGGGWMFGV